MGDSPSDLSAELGRTTLAENLLASSSNAQFAQIEASMLAELSEEQLREVFERMEKSENDGLDKVRRRMNTMLEAVREAKNVAKPVQQVLAEAMTAFKHVTGARKLHQ